MSATSAVERKPQTDAAQAPEWANELDYLLGKGWTVEEDGMIWYDPTKPQKDDYKEIPVTFIDDEGKTQPVMVKDDKGRLIQGKRTHCTPADRGVSKDAALAIQRRRDKMAAAKR